MSHFISYDGYVDEITVFDIDNKNSIVRIELLLDYADLPLIALIYMYQSIRSVKFFKYLRYCLQQYVRCAFAASNFCFLLHAFEFIFIFFFFCSKVQIILLFIVYNQFSRGLRNLYNAFVEWQRELIYNILRKIKYWNILSRNIIMREMQLIISFPRAFLFFHKRAKQLILSPIFRVSHP